MRIPGGLHLYSISHFFFSPPSFLVYSIGDLTIQYESTRIFGIFFIMGSVLIFAASMATIVEVYVEQLDVIVSEQPEITEEWVAKVLEHEGGEEVSKERFIIAALEQFGVIDHKKHVRPLTTVLSQNSALFRSCPLSYSTYCCLN
jgi:hypothetical protein